MLKKKDIVCRRHLRYGSTLLSTKALRKFNLA
jgi:hypothetical protein